MRQQTDTGEQFSRGNAQQQEIVAADAVKATAKKIRETPKKAPAPPSDEAPAKSTPCDPTSADLAGGWHRLQAGMELIEACQRVPPGEWRAWCEAEFDLPYEDIQKIMRMASSVALAFASIETALADMLSDNDVREFERECGRLITDYLEPGDDVGAPAASVEAERAPKPAVQIKKTITADYIICLEDGRKFKTMTRHLWTAYNLSPEEYHAKWGLPWDYPMVAPSYSEKRRHMRRYPEAEAA